MNPQLQLYIILLLAGLLLFGFEVFLPGGVLGAIGAIALVAALVVGFFAFDPPYSYLSAISIIILSAINVMLWLMFVPKTRLGRSMTLSSDGTTFKSSATNSELLGKKGTANTDLRPAGIAFIEEERFDVVADSSWIEKGTPIEVIEVHGNRIIVAEIQEESSE